MATSEWLEAQLAIKTIILQGHTEQSDYITCSKLPYLKHLVNPNGSSMRQNYGTHGMKPLAKMNFKKKLFVGYSYSQLH